MALRNAVQLITYPDRLGRNLGELYQLLDRHLGDALGGVHILPLYPSNADGGFSPLTHMEVDPLYGDWADVERISARFDLCVDLVISHIADESPAQNMNQLLQSRVPSVSVSSASGTVGTSARINIRGASSITRRASVASATASSSRIDPCTNRVRSGSISMSPARCSASSANRARASR